MQPNPIPHSADRTVTIRVRDYWCNCTAAARGMKWTVSESDKDQNRLCRYCGKLYRCPAPPRHEEASK